MYIVNSSLDLLADLYEAGTLGVIEHDGWVEAFFEHRVAAARFGDPAPCEEIDWVRRHIGGKHGGRFDD